MKTALAAPSTRLDRLCLRPLAATVALILCTTAPAAIAAGLHVVTTCNDTLTPVCGFGDDGTLRQAYFCATGNDTIDLTQLQCSKITLHAALASAFGNVTLNGPGREKLTIEAGGKFRVLAHSGAATDTLSINGLTITDGHYENPYTYSEGGGCIFSSANVSLNSSRVSGCYTSSPLSFAAGGAILAKGDVTLVNSTISSSTAAYSSSESLGGGIRANSVHLVNSRLSYNRANRGGAISANFFQSYSSTIAYNYANIIGGGAYVRNSSVIVNSTIWRNRAGYIGGVDAIGGGTVYNSTIAFNYARPGGFSNKLAAGITGRYLYLESSIVAGNMAGSTPSDVAGTGAGLTISGTHNLVMASIAGTNVLPDTITADPQLLGLADNGGPTATVALSPSSPAINHGVNFLQLPFDQRGVPRVIGGSADIGAFESDHLFSDGFNP